MCGGQGRDVKGEKGADFRCRDMGDESDLGAMFEGALRSVETWPAMWWLAWMALAFLAGGLRWSDAAGFGKRLRWPWTDVRLLFQEKGDGSGMTWADVLIHGGAGAAAGLTLTSLLGQGAGQGWDSSLFWRVWAIWFLLGGIRWGIGRLMGVLTGSESQGNAWVLHHRWMMESTAWCLAPLGVIGVVAGPSGSEIGMTLWMVGWALSWCLRQRRTVFRLPMFRTHTLIPMLYLCALEILPVAVLFRAWKG